MFSEISFKGISFGKLTPLTFLSKILRFSEISFKGISLIKNDQKCAGQLSYGFNISDKLEGCTHEKIFPNGDLDFLNFVYKRFGINGRVRSSNFASFQTFF